MFLTLLFLSLSLPLSPLSKVSNMSLGEEKKIYKIKYCNNQADSLDKNK